MIIINNTDRTGALKPPHTLRDRPNGGVCAGGSEIDRRDAASTRAGAWQCVSWTFLEHWIDLQA